MSSWRGSLITSVVTASITSLGILGVQYFMFKQEVSQERCEIRRSFLAELEQLEKIDEYKSRYEAKMLREGQADMPPPTLFTTKIYEIFSDDLGVLTSDERETIITFYTRLEFSKRLMEEIFKGNDLPYSAYEILVILFHSLSEQRAELAELIDKNKAC